MWGSERVKGNKPSQFPVRVEGGGGGGLGGMGGGEREGETQFCLFFSSRYFSHYFW